MRRSSKKQLPSLWIDQYGNRFRARTVSELREQVGGGQVSIMYRDQAKGPPVRVGYVVGQHWLTEYAPVLRDAITGKPIR